ncbi:hypothetical protein [Namhaeicola litoreus]|uniref:Lipocalin-like domain-containing protein n=1 Tax=Namhaeicola litoreus TaxID=1052145 RepID=A0ABW3XY87_9FLAO
MWQKTLLVIFFLSTLLSCSNEEETKLNKYPQKWILVKMTYHMTGTEVSGLDMPWQEIYLLNENGTFKKQRESEGAVTEESGLYKRIENNNETLLEFHYKTPSEIVGSCTGNQLETLWLKTNNILVSTWLQCDGPGLEYHREF